MVNSRRSLLLSLVVAAAMGAADSRAATDTAEELALRRSEIEQLSPSARDELRRNLEKFERLSSAEQERLRTLDMALDAEPQLRKVLVEFHEWLEALDSVERAEVLALPPEKRIAWIKQRQKQQSWTQNARQASRAKQWVNAYIKRHSVRLEKERAEQISNAPPNARPPAEQPMMDWMMAQWRDRAAELSAGLDGEDLRAWGDLLDEGESSFLRLTTDQQRDEVRRQLHAAAQKYRGDRSRWITREELARFHRTLPLEEQERIMAIPTEEARMRELRKKFVEVYPFREGRRRGTGGGNQRRGARGQQPAAARPAETKVGTAPTQAPPSEPSSPAVDADAAKQLQPAATKPSAGQP